MTDIDIIGDLYEPTDDPEAAPVKLPGFHVNVTREGMPESLAAFEVDPQPGRRVWAGDVLDGARYVETACLTFTTKAKAKANLGDLWPAEPEALHEPGPIDLDALKAERNAAITAKREEVFAAGFTPSIGQLAGHTLQVRNDQDKINWLTSAASYSAAVGTGHGAVPGATFRTMANETVVVTFAEGAKVIVQDMAAWGQAIMQRSWDLKDEIDAASDLDALEAIDIEVGWP